MERYLFTAVVLLPDWLADTFGQDIYIAQVDVHTDDAKLAAEAARKQASRDYLEDGEDNHDFFVLATFEGHANSVFSDHFAGA